MQGMAAEPTWGFEHAGEGVSWNDMSSQAGKRMNDRVNDIVVTLLNRLSWEGSGQASEGPFFSALSPAGGWWAL